MNTAIRAALVFSAILAPLRAADVYGASDYDVTPTGMKSVYAGYDAMLAFRVSYFPGARTRYFYYDSITNLPDGVTAEIFCSMQFPCPGTPPKAVYPNPQFETGLHVTATPTAAPGIYTITLNSHDYEGHRHSTPLPLTVLAAPDPPAGPPSYQPPIPTLAQWQQVMKSEGARFCNATNKNQTYAFGYEASVWYYDGARVFYQIYDATGEDIWKDCAENEASQYADFVNGYGCQNGKCGGIPPWRVFPRGLRMAYERTGNDKYRQAVENLAANGIGSQMPGALDDTSIRETAYAADALIEPKLINSPNFDSIYAPKLNIVVNQLLSMYEVLFDSHTYAIHQPFYDALAAEALIDYYRYVTPDPRIPVAIRKMLDWTWDVSWDHKTLGFVYQPDHVPWYPTNGLLGLTVPAYAWYYSVSGDALYLQRGDELFGHIFDDPFWSGKQFSQTFRWTFDYVKWRSEPAISPIGVTVPEHVYPSGGQDATIWLAAPAAGKCGHGVRLAGNNVLGLADTTSLDPGSSSKAVHLRPYPSRSEKATITASYRNACGQAAVTGTAVTTVAPDHLDVVLTAARVPGGMIQNNRVTIDGPVPDADTQIALSSDAPDLVRFFDLDGNQTASVTLLAGRQRSDYFYLDTSAVAAPRTVTVTATAGELTGSATFTIDPPAPRLALRNGHKLVGGFATCFNQVILDQPAPAGGMPVTVWSAAPAILPGTLTVQVPEGQNVAPLCLTPGMAAAGESAMYMMYGSGKYFVYDIAGETRTLKFSGMPVSVRSGASATGKIAFDAWIPARTDIRLTSNSAAIRVPDIITLARSATIDVPVPVSFSIQAGTVTASTSVTITATSPTGHTATATLTVTP